LELNNINEHKFDSSVTIEFERLLKLDKNQLLKTFEKTRSDLITMSDEVKKVVVHAEYNNWKEIKEVWNVIGFIVLASLDLKTYIEIMLRSDDVIHKIAITRMIYTQIYEIADDLTHMTNINFTDSMKKIECDELVNELYEKRKLLSDFKKKYDKELVAVRSTVGAHREQNYVEFHNMLTNLDYTASLRIVVLFDSILNELGVTTKKIMDSTIQFANKTYNKR
jgi:hypothetical protein